MKKDLRLFHGSPMVVETPELSKGNPHSDFGQGFYCTESRELALEWAVDIDRDGYSNEYLLDTSGFKILDLNKGYNVLNWMATLVRFRNIELERELQKEAAKYLVRHFSIDIDDADIIKGYRADDSYFSIAQDFLSGIIGVNTLGRALKLGDLGEQIVLKSPEAFERVKFIGHEVADHEVYWRKREQRNLDAEQEYLELDSDASRDLLMVDILREEIQDGDTRIPRTSA
ncbi:MAG: DUF3990 domain-containing protein [archaeon]|nr:DUF3990 domain-containing protein [archaeon]